MDSIIYKAVRQLRRSQLVVGTSLCTSETTFRGTINYYLKLANHSRLILIDRQIKVKSKKKDSTAVPEPSIREPHDIDQDLSESAEHEDTWELLVRQSLLLLIPAAGSSYSEKHVLHFLLIQGLPRLTSTP